MVACRSCEYIAHDGWTNVCHYPSCHRSAFVSRKWDDKPHWCPKGKGRGPGYAPEDLLRLYINSGNPLPPHLLPAREVVASSLPVGDK